MFCCSLGYQESMELWPQTSTWHQQPLQSQVRQLPVYLFTLDTFCTKTRCSRPKCSLSWIYTSWKWYHTIFYVLTQEFKKKCISTLDPCGQKADPTILGVDTWEPKGLENQEKAKDFGIQFMNLSHSQQRQSPRTGTCAFHVFLGLLLPHFSIFPWLFSRVRIGPIRKGRDQKVHLWCFK